MTARERSTNLWRSPLRLCLSAALCACGGPSPAVAPATHDTAVEASSSPHASDASVQASSAPSQAARSASSGVRASAAAPSAAPPPTAAPSAASPTPAASASSQAGASAASSNAASAGTAGTAGTISGSSGASASQSATAPDALTPEELMHECGVAPAGLAPRIQTIKSSKTPDVELSMAIQGDPGHPPVVLVHGFPDFWCGWAPVIPELAQRYFVVAPDMRGYNRSSKPGNPDDPQDLAAYLLPELERDLADIVHFAALQTQQKVSVVAHDWGAIVAWPFAHDYPEDLSRLMAVSVSHPACLSQFLANGDPALATAQAQQAQALTYISELVMNDSPAQFSADNYKKLFDSLDQKHLHKPNAFPEVEREAYRRMWDADNQASFKSQIKYYRANFGGGGQAQTSDLMTPVPTAFVAPVYDGAILYPHSMDYLREHVAKEQPVLLRPIETGHFPQREEPARLARMIQQFVDVDWQTP